MLSVPMGSYGHTFRGTRDLRDASVAIENAVLQIARAMLTLRQTAGLPHTYLYISRIRCLNNRPFNHEKIYLDLSFFTICSPQALECSSIRWPKRHGDRRAKKGLSILPSADAWRLQVLVINRCYRCRANVSGRTGNPFGIVAGRTV
ncbi:hypothetical protein KCP73_11180 [Salmonella enterica subsp. enterica]|nr:hypothetical protein KCP73_11180 [Salmonella enterica subsp. enterica]